VGVVDPFGGQQDLENKILRTVGNPRERFSEDALRILRGVRFAVRFGLTPDSETLQAMKELAPTMEKLARERVFDELCKLLPLVNAQDLLEYAPILTQAVPALAPCVGFLQNSPYHLYDVYGHTARVVEASPASLAVRWAALLHDCGKPDCYTEGEDGVGHFYGHAQLSEKLAEDMLTQLKAPTALRKRVCLLVGQHMTPLEPDKRLLRRRLGQFGQEALRELLALQRADVAGLGTTEDLTFFDEIARLLEEVLAEDACLSLKDLAINGEDLQNLGFDPGKALGECLQQLLERVQNEELPNEKDALLAAAKENL
jgi:tRNA nucleotidyltransferase (CCA-adding enzyme)